VSKPRALRFRVASRVPRTSFLGGRGRMPAILESAEKMSLTYSAALSHSSESGKFAAIVSMAGWARTQSPIQLGTRTRIFIIPILCLAEG